MQIEGSLFRERSISSVARRAAWLTVLYLGGGLTLSFILAIGISNAPIHMNELLKNTGAALALLAFLLFASLRWGVALAQLAGLDSERRAARIAGVSFTATLFGGALSLGAGESLFGTGIPIHVLYGLLFVPATFLIVGVVGLTWGRALGNWRFGGELALRSGGPACLAFLAAYLLMDFVGYRVGAPGAAERATMITVTFVGCLAAAAAGGAGLGSGLFRYARGR